jgi:transposase-like protein
MENIDPQTVPSTPTNAKRRRFSNSERLTMVRNVRRRVAFGESIRKACRLLNIEPKQYREWERTATNMRERNPQRPRVCTKAHN